MESIYRPMDAHLIAAAPDLLRACNMGRADIIRGSVDDVTLEVLENAIKKANNE
ncbi:hypothetical protein [Anaerophaga thermohalophila]|jgi:hypothetical protein|uniref:hypothetical protein n=1 Tax=Anaerophaga thermohalophila TaxID=177400 RepID=UPI000237C822|nr:hypothetical protein [Anaerophaga thermohalophila]